MSEGNGVHPDPTDGMVEQPPRTLGQQLGLGQFWGPGPVGWSWAELQGGPEGKLHLLVLHTPTGLTGLVFAPSDLRKFVAEALERTSGLVMPGGAIPPGPSSPIPPGR